MGKARTAATGAVLLLASIVTIAAAVKTAGTAWPVTGRQHRAQLTEQLTDAGFMQLSDSEKLKMAQQFELDFGKGLGWQSDIGAMGDDDRETFHKNLARLMHLSLLEKVDRYFELPQQNRAAFLDEHLDDLMSLQILGQDSGGAAGKSSTLGHLIAVAGYVGDSLKQCDGRQREQLLRFMVEAKNHAERRGFADFRLTPERFAK